MTRPLLVLLAATLIAPLPAVRERLDSDPERLESDPEVRLFIKLVNAYRESIGCPAFVVDLRAESVAQAHSEDMYERRYVGHVNPDGRSHSDRLRLAGVSFSAAGENIAQSDEGGRTVLDLWLASPPHRANIQNCSFTRHGVGHFETRWTHVMYAE